MTERSIKKVRIS